MLSLQPKRWMTMDVHSCLGGGVNLIDGATLSSFYKVLYLMDLVSPGIFHKQLYINYSMKPSRTKNNQAGFLCNNNMSVI